MSDGVGLEALAGRLYRDYGQSKAMEKREDDKGPRFFLLRRFKGELDLLVIFYAQRCRYQCNFCQLPMRSPRQHVGGAEISDQFRRVLFRTRDTLSVLDRVTLSNDGSILDTARFDADALDEIARAVGRLRNVRRLELESRLEFVHASRLTELARHSRAAIGVLTGLETLNDHIRTQILGKRQTLEGFVAGLDEVAAAGGACITVYVLVKPAPEMSDTEAIAEADETVRFLEEMCRDRGLDLTIRLNPMYVARGSRWEAFALKAGYQPPRLTDVMTVARRAAARGTRVYIGLSAEDLTSPAGTYRVREDFSKALLLQAIDFNRSAAPPADVTTVH
jgi:archaeosine synthase beta-subunit